MTKIKLLPSCALESVSNYVLTYFSALEERERLGKENKKAIIKEKVA